MADRKPTRSEGDEREVLMTALQFQRESFLRKVKGLSEEDARRVLVPSGTTLLWLTKHLKYAEDIWIRRRFAQETLDLDNAVHDGDTLSGAVAAYRAGWGAVDTIIGTSDFSARIEEPAGDDPGPTLRWIVTHLVEEVARHAGHADILRELIDGRTGR